MARNQPGVRIEGIEDLESFPLEYYSKKWPAGLASPQAAVDMILRNYGKDKSPMYRTERDMNYLREYYGPERFGGLTNGFMVDPNEDFYTKDEYDTLLDIANDAYNGDEDEAEYLNRLISRSNAAYANRKKRK